MSHRASLIQQARAIADQAAAEQRELTETERANVDRLWAAVDALESSDGPSPALADAEWEYPP